MMTGPRGRGWVNAYGKKDRRQNLMEGWHERRGLMQCESQTKKKILLLRLQLQRCLVFGILDRTLALPYFIAPVETTHVHGNTFNVAQLHGVNEHTAVSRKNREGQQDRVTWSQEYLRNLTAASSFSKPWFTEGINIIIHTSTQES